jgi:hypothetical protein
MGQEEEQRENIKDETFFRSCLGMASLSLLSKALTQSGNLGLDGVGALLQGELLGAVALAVGGGLLLGSLTSGVGTDGGMSLLVDGLDVLGLDSGLLQGSELVREVLTLLLDLLVVLRNVLTEDAIAVDLGIELATLESREAVGLVRDSETTIDGTLENTEDVGAGRRAGQTNVEDGLEGEALLGVILLVGLQANLLELTVSLLDTGELVGDAKLGEGAAGQQETGGIGGGVVRQTEVDSVALELMGVGGHEGVITDHLGVDDLSNDITVGDAGDEAELGGAILGLVLKGHRTASAIVSLSLAASAVLDLVALEVSLVLNYLDERHPGLFRGKRDERELETREEVGKGKLFFFEDNDTK